MVDLKKLLLKILSAPMVIDSGTRINEYGEINWMKWSNGRLEIDGLLTNLTISHYSGPINGFYGYYYEVNWGNLGDIPVFINSNYSVVHTWWIGGSFAIPATQMNRATNKIWLYALTNASGSQSAEINFHIVGRWK